jgi:hypothetical protein
MVGLLGWAGASLAESGKIIAVNGVLMLWKWRRRLKPRRDRLEQIIRDMNVE